MDEWTECLERGGGRINAIYTDFEKAFDKVPHQLLLQKLQLYKVDPSVINWIKSFLCFRKQRVRLINGFFSEWTEVISGISQGTILGPVGLFFIIYINDIPDMRKQLANVYLFADDVKLSRHVPYKNCHINCFLS